MKTQDLPEFHRLDDFTRQYIETALWSSTWGDPPEPLDDEYGPEDLSPELLASVIEDCEAFQESHSEDIASDPSRAGHDFWLTRNGHGAGFWDGDWPDEVGKRLTKSSHAYGGLDIYPGDDGMLYC